MKKVLFLIHDLGQGGAEKVLVNLVNNMDRNQFDITVMSLFGGGINEKFLNPEINYKTIFKKTIPGNSHIMKIFSPKRLHQMFIKEHYDIEIAFLEGPSTRIISGCSDWKTKLVSWTHCTMASKKTVAIGFRNYDEAICCYQKFHKHVFVSKSVEKAFRCECPLDNNSMVLYNTNDSEKILQMAEEEVQENLFRRTSLNLCGVGKLVPNKGFDRMLRIHKRLITDGYNVCLHIIGAGPQENELKQWCKENGLGDTVSFLGYQKNPYKYLAKCDLFLCTSHSEGFSTAATEALIVGIPVCTVDVSGMKEMLGDENEYGIVTDNDETALYNEIKKMIDNPELLEQYKQKATERGRSFSTQNTVNAVEYMLLNLLRN